MSVMVPVPLDHPSDPRPTRLSFRRAVRFLAAISALCAAAAFPASSVFDLHVVTVAGNTAVQADEVLRLADLRPGLGAFRVNAGAIREQVLQDPRIEDVAVAMDFPSRVRLWVRERTPIAALVAADGYLLLSADGVVITASADHGARPVLLIDRLDPADVSIGARLRSPDALLGAYVAGTLPEALKDRVAAVRVDGAGEALLALWNGTAVKLGGMNGMTDRLEMVPTVLDAIAARGIQVESVDLRFPGNVVIHPAGSPGTPTPPGTRKENLPVRGIPPAMHRPSVP
jgi:cell division protein FtsQ